jgi:hypothetical protein
MGFAITWYAVRETNAEDFLKQLELLPTGETEEFPESLISTAKLDTGWRILWYNEYNCPFLGEDELGKISENYDIMRVLVEEHVMASSSEMWLGGKCKWWLSHQGENGPKGLSVEGEPPESLPKIRSEMEQAQPAAGGDKADVDHIFEIPLMIAQSIAGFKHDEDCVDQFQILTRSAQKSGFLNRIFGGRK